MQFNEYLKTCREHSHLTQEQLVQDLYLYDDMAFDGLDTNTISRWERGISKPKLPRQVNIIKYFQKITHKALPCWEQYSTIETEELICKAGMQNLLGKSKKLILDFPDKMMRANDLVVSQLRNTEEIDKVIEINMELDQSFNHKFTGLLPEDFETWALHNSNSFYICEYKKQFFGLLFTLRLKLEAFEKIMNHEIKEKELTTNDLASLDEMGSNYIISFFALNKKAASMLFIRYYAHLISYQSVISEVGAATMMEDARKLLGSMNLHHHKDLDLYNGLTIQTWRETLPNFLASEQVVKMILSKQSCPEE